MVGEMIFVILLYMLRNYYLAVLGGPKWFTTKGKVTPFQSLKGINFGLTSGYTLIELIVVISIIGILASFVVVDQVSYYNKLAFAADVERFMGDMEYARDYAVSRKKRCVITIDAAAGENPDQYSFNLGTAAGTEVILPHNSGNHTILMPDGASITEGPTTITLDTRGRPDDDQSLTYTSTKYSPDVSITLNSITGFITRE